MTYTANSEGCVDCMLSAQAAGSDEKPWPFYAAGCEGCSKRMLGCLEATAFPGVDIDRIHAVQADKGRSK